MAFYKISSAFLLFFLLMIALPLLSVAEIPREIAEKIERVNKKGELYGLVVSSRAELDVVLDERSGTFRPDRDLPTVDISGPLNIFTQTMASDDEGDFHEDQGPPVIDEANVQEGLRAFFPLSFGKQEKKQVSLESIHSATKRPHDPQPKSLKPQSGKKGWLQDLNPKPIGSLRPSPDLAELPRPPIGPQRPPANLVELPRPPMGPQRPPNSAEPIVGPPRPPYLEESAIGDEEDSDQLVGPPRPPQFSGDDDEEEGALIGPPRPPQFSGDDDEEERALIGPPRPPSNLEGGGDDGSFEAMTYRREDETSDDYSDEEGGYMLRMPLSNEIVLKGHTKVWILGLDWINYVNT